MFTIEDFACDAQKDLYTCPASETLRGRGYHHRGSYVRYAAKASACNECPLKSKCTRSPKGQWVSRSPGEEYLDRVRVYRKALRKRAVWVEPLFGEAKEWQGLRRFRLRGLEKVNSEALMIASGHNVKRLVDLGSRRPEKIAMVAALRPPEKLSPPRSAHIARARCRVFQQCPMALAGPHRRYENEVPPRLFSHQAGSFCELSLDGVVRSLH